MWTNFQKNMIAKFRDLWVGKFWCRSISFSPQCPATVYREPRTSRRGIDFRLSPGICAQAALHFSAAPAELLPKLPRTSNAAGKIRRLSFFWIPLQKVRDFRKWPCTSQRFARHFSAMCLALLQAAGRGFPRLRAFLELSGASSPAFPLHGGGALRGNDSLGIDATEMPNPCTSNAGMAHLPNCQPRGPTRQSRLSRFTEVSSEFH